MDNKLIINMMTKDAKEIESLIAEFDKYPTIPQILIDLTQSKIKNLYTELQLLNKTSDQLLSIQYEANMFSKDETSKIDFQIEEISEKEPEPLFEPISEEMKTQKREKHLLSTQLKFDSIPNIKEAIDINKKIWFNKELFKGNIDLYNKTIDILNNMKDLREALDYIDTNFNWDIDDKTVKDFMEYIYRRYF